MVKGTLVSDIKHDINPKSWLSKYQRNSLTYILLMFLFYIAISNAALHASSLIATYFNLPYRESYSSIFDEVFTGVLAGPLEDTWFFAIPLFTAVGNPFIVLASGIMWSVIHIFKGEVLGYDNFYIFANAIETIPALFFILRTWASGKGWFSIILHSTYDVILALSIC